MTTLRTKKPHRVTVSTAKTTKVVPPTVQHPLDKVVSIFKDEPLMDALMEHVRADRQAEREAETAE